MPIYNYKRAGQMGYSGANPISYGNEVLTQNTFTPDYDLWYPDGSFTFDEGGAHYSVLMGEDGDLYQESTDFLTPLEAGTYYFEWETSFLAGDVRYEIFFGETATLAGDIQTGTFGFEVSLVGTEAYLEIYLSGVGTVDIQSVSLKKLIGVGKGISGYSGIEPDNVPIKKCQQVMSTTEETLVEDFNTLLSGLRKTGWMAGEIPS
jgi:hypothetical protein